MSPDQPFSGPADPTAPFRRAFNALLGAGRDLLGRVQAAITHRSTANLAKRFASNPVTAEQRIARTLDWIHALARTLAGDRTWLIVPSYVFPRFPGRYPALTAQLRAEIGLPPVPPRTEAEKAAAHRRYVRHVFATQPVAKIAKRLARRLGIAQSADAWPTDLLTITQTPVAWAKSAHAKPTPPPTEIEATPPEPPPRPNAPTLATGPPEPDAIAPNNLPPPPDQC